MIKTMSIVSRMESLSREEFITAWTGRHAELVRQVPGVDGYVQNVIDPATSGVPRGAARGPIDGIAEMWFQDRDAMQAALASAVWRLVVEDGAAIIGSVTPLAVTEVTVVGQPR